MKHLLSIAIACVLLFSCSHSGGDKKSTDTATKTDTTKIAETKTTPTIPELPPMAKAFIDTIFPGVQIVSIVHDDKHDDREFKTILADGTYIDFDKDGNWERVKNKSGVPLTFIPNEVAKYVTSKYANVTVIDIEHSKTDVDAYEVYLENKIKMEFDKDGKFIAEKHD